MFSKVRIFGTFENPLFVANDIGKILGIKRIITTISEYENDEIVRGIQIVDFKSDSGYATVNMLTEAGLYRILYTSRTLIAK